MPYRSAARMIRHQDAIYSIHLIKNDNYGKGLRAGPSEKFQAPDFEVVKEEPNSVL
ncbi:unnamed protein product [Brassica oleracea var. botrytis]|uniref:Uncharacterized protein n=2 Tax=Brassica TaxID=3705 RepID=A0A0D3ANE9_BRAOL|nr:unnamed protein product [Brassica napus]